MMKLETKEMRNFAKGGKEQNFKAEEKDQVWVGDITYIKTVIGWMYRYASKGYQKMLEENGITGSMSRGGCPYDNSCVESFLRHCWDI